MIRACVTGLSIALATGVTAQEVIGRSVVDGRAIQILDDGTWRYARPTEGGCEDITGFLRFCGKNDGWSRTTIPNPDVAAAYRYDDRHYAQVISEELGSDDGMTAEFMRKVVVENAAGIVGLRVEDIPVLDVYPSEVDGQPIETIAYTFEIDGLNVVYANGIFSSPNRTMQLMTFAIGTKFSDRHRSLHEAFLSQLRMDQ
ncbi:hypothetical protein [Yoonia sp. SS1-5]|uniref:Uncharacterized protein n=1 Tax=Yoonia rhodophyticola TaxID=3137370 RepID=A0AAN0NL78_9RHOB